MAPALTASDAQVHALAREILARHEYAQWSGERLGAWVDVLQHIERALRWLAQLSETRPLLYAAIITGLLVVALLLVVHLVIAVRAALRASRRAPLPSPPTTTASFLADAEVLARAGRWLEATHQLELAVIALLLRRRVVELARSEPNRTLRQRLGAAPLPLHERRELVHLIDRFEARWFRDRLDDPELYAAWRALYERLTGLPQPA
jgi:hypothetical protein